VDKVKRPTTILLVVYFFILPSMFQIRAAESGDQPFQIDWKHMRLNVSGQAAVTPSETGNQIEWQYDAAVRAESDLWKNIVFSMGSLRIDAFNTARDILMREPEKNELVFDFTRFDMDREVRYDDGTVEVTESFPFFGEHGFIPRLVSAGRDPGRFPHYPQYRYSRGFTGLVIDARGLGRVPAVAPAIYDQDHNTCYSIDLIDAESFNRWGAVRYTDDPHYKGLEDRVGQNPFRIVAMENDKLIPTDIGIDNDDAAVFFQREESRESLRRGNLIIILEEKLLGGTVSE
jgi:hypothetical protein